MKTTFVCDNNLLVSVPCTSDSLPDAFHCVFTDTYKVFVVKGRPKPLGAAQAVGGVLVLVLGLMFAGTDQLPQASTLPSVLFVVCGALTYASGRAPNMFLTKVSFCLNVTSFLWAGAAIALCGIQLWNHWPPAAEAAAAQLNTGTNALVVALLLLEMLLSVLLTQRLSRAVCRRHFNTLPTVLLTRNTSPPEFDCRARHLLHD